MIKEAGMCSPIAMDNFKKNRSCLSLSELKTLAIAFNKIALENGKNGKNSNTKTNNNPNLNLKPIPLSQFKNFNSLYNALNHRFSPFCGDKQEDCWIEQHIVKNENSVDLYKSLCKKFRPLMKNSWIRNRRELLDTFDIARVMKQYDDFYTDFSFLGVFPIDFMKKDEETSVCVVNRICKFNLFEYLMKGIKHFGIVFNFDPHDQPGSHWVSFYMNFDQSDPRYGFFYYDSFATEEPKEVRSFFNLVKDQFIRIHQSQNTIESEYKNSPFLFKRNETRHQYKNTECGAFSIFFLILCLENPKMPIHTTLKKKLYPKCDDLINEKRNAIFRMSPHVTKS